MKCLVGFSVYTLAILLAPLLICAQYPSPPSPTRIPITEVKPEDKQAKIYQFTLDSTPEPREKLRRDKLAQDLRRRQAELQPTTVEKFRAAWLVDLQVVDQPARKVLEQRLAELGLSLAVEPALTEMIDRRITFPSKRLSRLEVIEKICHAIGGYPDYSEMAVPNGAPSTNLFAQAFAAALCPPDQAAKKGEVKRAEVKPASTLEPIVVKYIVTIRAGKRPWPIVFSGPLAAEIVELKEHAPYGVGQLEVRVIAAGIPHDVVGCEELVSKSSMFHWSYFTTKPFTDQRGRGIAGQHHYSSPWNSLPAVQAVTQVWSLSPLLSSSEELQLRGTVSYPVPLQVTTLRLPDPAAGKIVSADGFVLELLAMKPATDPWEKNKNSQVSFRLTSDSVSRKQIDFGTFAYDAHDQILSLGNGSRSSGGYDGHSPNGKNTQPTSVQYSGAIEGRAKSLVIKIPRLVEVVEFPIELNVPLKSFREQPEALTALKYGGDAPATIDALKFIPDEFSSKLNCRFTNRSNKEIERFHYHLTYWDRSGKQVGQWTAGFHSGPAGKFAPVLGPGISHESEVNVPFVPKEAASVTVELQEVKFMDAMTWRPAKPMETVELKSIPMP